MASMPRMKTTASGALAALAAASLLAAPPARAAEDLYATFVTSQGKIGVRLTPETKPNAVKNFVELAEGKKEWVDPRTGAKVKKPLYDGTLFHRVIPRFMIQGGDPLTQGAPFGATTAPNGRPFGTGDPGFRFEDELKPGTTPFATPCQLAMANSGPNTNGSQFFITEVPTPHLDRGHTIFGEAVKGQELVAKIARAGNARTRLEKVVITRGKMP